MAGMTFLMLLLETMRRIGRRQQARKALAEPDRPPDEALDDQLVAVLAAAAHEALGAPVSCHHVHVHRERSASAGRAPDGWTSWSPTGWSPSDEEAAHHRQRQGLRRRRPGARGRRADRIRGRIPLAAAAHGAAKAVAPAPPARPAPARPPAVPLGPSGTPIKGDPNAILAPIAGTVQKVFVEAGRTVEAKAPVVLLDAMKMDTYIYAPRAGEVAEVAVAPGDAVQVGDSLIRYRPEA